MSDTKIDPIILRFNLKRSTKKSRNLSSGNEMINSNDRLHFHVKGELTRHLKEMSNVEIRNYIGDLGEGEYIFTKNNPCFIVVRVAPPSKRRMDAPNWYPTVKALVDGLTEAQIFEDDNDEVITSFTFVRSPKEHNTEYVVSLEIYPGTIGGVI